MGLEFETEISSEKRGRGANSNSTQTPAKNRTAKSRPSVAGGYGGQAERTVNLLRKAGEPRIGRIIRMKDGSGACL
jgi:hypothetical protein